MKRLFFLFLIISSVSFSQEDTELYYSDEEETEEKRIPQEIGIDAAFSASTFSGMFGVGLKYGFEIKKNLVVGPSVRFQRTWSKPVYTGSAYAFNVYGGGGFLHYRMLNYFFIGTEIELLSSPFNVVVPSQSRTWVVTALTGGGFSHEFENFRLNAGVYYDIANSPNSPFRYGYFIKNDAGVIQPIMYRLAVFLPI